MISWPRTARRSSTNPFFSSVKRLNLLLFSVNITAVGHIAIDRITTVEGETNRLGGPPSYASAVADVLGMGLDIVTRIGHDFPSGYSGIFLGRGISLERWICGSPTTRFHLDYTKEPRGLGVGVICDPISIDDIPAASPVLLSPIVGEIDGAIIGRLGNPFIAVDSQGFVRDIHSDSYITMKKWFPPRPGRVDLLKTSQAEHVYLTGIGEPARSLEKMVRSGVKVGVITLGGEGSMVLRGNRMLKVPVFPAAQSDSTGAGDCFLASMTHSLAGGSPLEWSCALASAVASLMVETDGPFLHANKSVVTERAEWVMEKIEKKG